MSCEAQLAEQLRKLGYRITPQRRVILHILRSSADHLTPSDVFALAQENLPGLTEATVYRTLEFLMRIGLAHAAFSADGKRAYEISDHRHHHLLCRQCGSEIEIPHARFSALFEALEKDTDFAISHNHLTILGLCPKCQ